MSKFKQNKVDKNPPTPRTVLRGYFHAGFAPLALASSIVLICISNTQEKKIASAIFLITSTLLFTISAIYHIFNWSKRVKTIFRRIDHSNVFLIIAGTYTPLTVSMLPFSYKENGFFSGQFLLISIWVLCLIGLFTHIIWFNSPRILQVITYIFLGIFSVIYMPTMWHVNSRVVILIAVGGLLYIIGAVIYGAKRPLTYARVFGFHELFHNFTIAAYICHTIGIYIAILRN